MGAGSGDRAGRRKPESLAIFSVRPNQINALCDIRNNVIINRKQTLKLRPTLIGGQSVVRLIKRQQYDRLMLLRVDDIDISSIPGLYSYAGSLDIRDMPDANVAEAILSRLREDKPPSVSYRSFTSKLPVCKPDPDRSRKGDGVS